MKYVVAIALLLIGLPRITNSAVPLVLNGGALDLRYYQLAIAIAAILIAFRMDRVRRSRLFSAMLSLAVSIFFVNIARLLLGAAEPQPLLRGILNLSVNTATCGLIALFLRGRRNSFLEVCSGMQIFGCVLAASAFFEYFLVRFASGYVIVWRTLVCGPLQDPNSILRAGGTILDQSNLVRVGGLIGSPENLGLVLALTLPVVFLGNLSLSRKGLMLALYAFVAIIASSRGLAIAILLCALVALVRKRTRYMVILLALGIACFVLLHPATLDYVAMQWNGRFNASAANYEVAWRSTVSAQLLNAVHSMQLGPIFGIGFGWGSEARYGIASVTSGLLGGDVIVAYAFGGLIGLSFVFAFWWYILMSRKKARTDASRLAADMVILLVAAYSVIEPILLQLVFTTGVVSVMLLVCLCMLERSHTFFSHRIAFRCFYCESPAYFQHPK